jgi:CBS domain-containing protein
MATQDDALPGDEAYYDEQQSERGFDASLLERSLKTLPARRPLVHAPDDSVTEAIRAMQREQRGCVLVTQDGTPKTRLVGIFSERDVLYRIVDRGRNPATLALSEVMTPDPESLPEEATVAWVLNKMAVGGFRHVPVVDADGRPVFVVSVRDVVEFLVEFFPGEVLNLPPEFGAPRSLEREGA